MPIKLKCECGEIMQVAEEHAGKVGKCPHCGKANKIPTLEEIEKFRKKAAPKQQKPAPERKKTGARKKIERGKTKAPKRKSRITSRRTKDEEEKPAKKSKRGKTASRRDKTASKRGKTASRRSSRKLEPSASGRTSGRISQRYQKEKKPIKPMPIVIALAVIAVLGVAAIFIFSTTDIEGAKKRYLEFGEAQQIDVLYTNFEEFCDLYTSAAEPEPGEVRDKIDKFNQAWRSLELLVEEKFPIAEDTRVYKLLASAVKRLDTAESYVKRLAYNEVKNDPAKKQEVINSFRQQVRTIQRDYLMSQRIRDKKVEQVKKAESFE